VPGPLDNAAGATIRGARRFTPDQQALVVLSKEARRRGVTGSQAETLLNWASEVGLPAQNHIDTAHWIGGPHIRVGPVNHIPVR
jgi:hypothetical protein